MMVWIILIFLILIVIPGYLLLAPVIVEINTNRSVYRVRLHRLVFIDVTRRGFQFIAHIRVLFWKTEFPLLGSKRKVKRREVTPEAKQQDKKKKSKFSSRKALAILRSFRVLIWKVVVDTGDNPLNGMLYPVFYMLSVWSGRTFRISFCDENLIHLKLRNNLGRILWVYLQTKR